MSLITLNNLIVHFYKNGPLEFEGVSRHVCGGCVLIPKRMVDRRVRAILDAQRAAKVEAFGLDTKVWPNINRDRHPLRDGDEEHWDGFEGHWYLAFQGSKAIEIAPKAPKPSFLMVEGVFKFIAGDFGGMRIRCEPVSIVEDPLT